MLEKNEFKAALDFLEEIASEKNFDQSVDVIFNLKNLNLKSPDDQVDIFIQLPHERGKKTTVACLCGPELLESAKEHCDLAISTDEFPKYQKDKKAVKKLANQYDYFIAQANIMPDVAKVFGRFFGPRGKMPNPKAGGVVAPNANLDQVMAKFRKTVRLTAKKELSVKARAGLETQDKQEVIDNLYTMYERLLRNLPQEDNNIKNVLIKLTMSKPVPVGLTPEEVKELWAEKEEARKRAAEQLAQEREAVKGTTAKRRIKTPEEEQAEKEAEEKDTAEPEEEKKLESKESEDSEEAEEAE